MDAGISDLEAALLWKICLIFFHVISLLPFPIKVSLIIQNTPKQSQQLFFPNGLIPENQPADICRDVFFSSISALDIWENLFISSEHP
jgi:hypothetical protein